MKVTLEKVLKDKLTRNMPRKPNEQFRYHELIPNQTKYMMRILTDCIIFGEYYVSWFMGMTAIQNLPENVHKSLPNSTSHHSDDLKHTRPDHPRASLRV